jgi:tetratricopeptide (TPR) repeat protein
MRNFYWLILLLFLSLSANGICQPGSAQEEAMQFYSEGNYSEALVRFKKLITLFPKNPKYYYYTGVCMVQTNTNIDEAIKKLLYASEYAVPRDVYFYLGKAYHYQYKFSEAKDAYQKFKTFGTQADQDKIQCEMYLAMARNGKEIYNYIKIKVLDKTPIDLVNLYPFYNENLKNGQFKSRAEKIINLKESADNRDWRYEPFLSEKDVLIFGSNQGLLKRNRDIYQAKKMKGKQWSRPETLGTSINSSFDEDYVYFNEAEPAIYFASKGHNSMGGYDIFKSVYNPDYKTWSDPINLGYPINSPYNDFLFVPSDDQQTAWFASDRETSGSKVMVYKIAFEKNYTFFNLPAGFVFTNILMPKIPENTAAPVVIPKTPESATTEVIPVTSSAVPEKNDFSVNTPDISSTKADNEYPQAFLQMNDYNKVVNDALLYQLKSDSTSRIINEQRDLLNNTTNESEKAAIKTRIFQLDKKAKLYQTKADSLYIKARVYENKALPEKKEDQMTVTTDMAKNALMQGKDKKQKGTPVVTTTKKTKTTPVLYEFKVMAKSPYKSTSEIPVNQPLPNGIVYRIQMGAFSKTIEPDRFKGIMPISGETITNSNVTKFYAGFFGRFADAEKALNKIKEYGFKDAFIVSSYNCKSIPTSRAVEMEKNN